MRDFPNLYLGLAAPSPLSGITENYITWHKIEERNIYRKDSYSLSEPILDITLTLIKVISK